MNKLLLRQFLLPALFVFSFCLKTFAQQHALLLPAETPLSLELTETLNSDSLVTGTEIELVVSDNLKIDDEIVIVKGTVAKARIVKANPELITPVRLFIEPYACMAADGQEITLGGPAAVFDASESGVEVIIREGTIIGSEVYTTYTILLNTGEEDPVPDEIPVGVEENRLFLPIGQEVTLVVSDEVVMSELEEGYPIKLRVKTDVLYQGKVVIAAKLPAEGYVKRLVGNKLYVSATSVTMPDGSSMAIDCDRSTIITLDPENEDDIQPVSGEIQAFISRPRAQEGHVQD